MTEVVKEEVKEEVKVPEPAPVAAGGEGKEESKLFHELEEETDPEKKQRREDINKIFIQLTKEGETAILVSDFDTAMHADRTSNVRPPVTFRTLVCRLLLDKKHK